MSAGILPALGTAGILPALRTGRPHHFDYISIHLNRDLCVGSNITNSGVPLSKPVSESVLDELSASGRN